MKEKEKRRKVIGGGRVRRRRGRRGHKVGLPRTSRKTLTVSPLCVQVYSPWWAAVTVINRRRAPNGIISGEGCRGRVSCIH